MAANSLIDTPFASPGGLPYKNDEGARGLDHK